MPTTNVNASVTSAKSSPRTPLTRKTTAPSATPRRIATIAAAGSVHRNGTSKRDASVAVVYMPGAEERAVPEGKVARVSREDVPGRGKDDPVEDEIQNDS